MYEGYIFAQKVDEGFPGTRWDGKLKGGTVAIAGSCVVFIQSKSLEEALDNQKRFKDNMEGGGLRTLAKEARTTEELKNMIDNSRVNGDSEAKVVYDHVILPRLPLPGSNYYLRFSVTWSNLTFLGVGKASETIPSYTSLWDQSGDEEDEDGNPVHGGMERPCQSDVQLKEKLTFNIDDEPLAEETGDTDSDF